MLETNAGASASEKSSTGRIYSEGGKSTPASAARVAVKVDGSTVPEAYLRRVALCGDEPAIRFKRGGELHTFTWNDFHSRVLAIFQALEKQGLKAGDKVAIFSQSRPEWMLVDMANMGSGLITVPIYHSNTVDDIAFILDQSEAKIVFVEDEKSCAKLVEVFATLKRNLPVVGFFGKPTQSFPFPIIDFNDIVNAGVAEGVVEKFKSRVQELTPQTTASIVYTSGTTGRPKGAVLTHQNFVWEIRALVSEIDLGPGDSTLTFLPFAHIMGRVESTLPIFSGVVLYFAESINTVAQDIAEVAPTLLVSVPRIYEKIYAKIQSEVQASADFQKNVFNWAVSIGKEYVRLKSEKQPIPLFLSLKYRAADQLVFSRVRSKMGGRIKLTLSGGAPLSQELCEFFHAAGIKIIEAYGLTETTAAITCNRPDDYCFGTVGKPIPGVELRIASDGEILARGPVIFKEYFNNPTATKEVFPEGDWFATGDIGEINERGFLRITDRKKELIVTSGGKNIAPQKLENALKTSRFISNCMVYGDKQKYISALVTLIEPEIIKWAKSQNISFSSYEDLTTNEAVVKMIESEVKQVNSQLASYESIKKIRILPADFTTETGELTPSLKVKRKVCIEKYRAYLESMYS